MFVYVKQVDDKGVLTWQAADHLVRWWVVMQRADKDWSIYAVLPASNKTIQLETVDKTSQHQQFYSLRALNSASQSSSAIILQL
jgi:hypothetical protein